MRTYSTLVEFVKIKFEKILPPHTYNRYLEMAGTIDLGGEEALSWTDIKAFKSQFDYPNKPTLSEWREFLRNQFIDSYLTNEVVSRKKPLLRELISNISMSEKLTPQHLKALESLSVLIEKSSKEENQTIYTQEFTSFRFVNDNGNIENLIKDRTEDTSDINHEINKLPDNFRSR